MDRDRAQAWRRRLRLDGAEGSGGLESTSESVGDGAAATERIRIAREEMRRIVMERFGGDAALLQAVDAIEVTSQEAVKLLEQGEGEPEPEQFDALEAVVAFDGTRPSFLLKDGEVDFASSLSTSQWKTTLAPRLPDLAAFASCVGRVESGESGLGTAFLVAPTLAVTNRHVGQLIASFGAEAIDLNPNVSLDFGREYQGRTTYDRREVRRVLFAGVDVVGPGVDHGKLDLALLEVAPSSLPGEAADRAIPLSAGPTEVPGGWTVAAVGYPDDWRLYVPKGLRTQYEGVIAKLLDGDSGSKRLAPGASAGMLSPVAGDPRWTATHDATTINGNSGSPLTILRGAGPLKAVGLHYGGQWQGERTNWAHVITACASAQVTPGKQDLRSALAAHGVKL